MTVREFDLWRQRDIELAQARGEGDFHLPSVTPYRNRWGSWEAALIHHGFSPDEVNDRLQPFYDPDRPQDEPYLPEGLPVAELAEQALAGVPLKEAELALLRATWAALPRRTRYILTVRVGMGTPKQTLREACAPLRVRLDRVSQIELQALDALSRTVAGEEATPRAVAEARDWVVEALEALGVLTG